MALRGYSVNLTGGSLTAAATTLIEISNHTNRSTIITRAWLSQQSNTTSSQQAVAISEQSTSGTSVAAPAIVPLDKDDASAGFTTKGLLTTQGTEGNIKYPDSFNWQNGWLYLPVPEERIAEPGAGIYGLRTKTTPPALTVNCGLSVLEIG